MINDDEGGSVAERAAFITTIIDQGTDIEIRGNFCLSSCTMYLGLSKVCILPETKFGFHGPSSETYGISLPPDDFEYWSQIIAQHYPKFLRRWYLAKARNRTIGFHILTGRELIDMGISKCQRS